MEEKFYMLRHGETVMNREKFATGWLDMRLTELGVQQAIDCAAIVEKLSLKPSVIIHTGLSRTLETAKIINRTLNIPLIECPDLKKQFFGDWQGNPWAEIYQQIERMGANPP